MKNTPLLILFFTVFIDLIGFGIVLPLLPNYAGELGASPLEIGVIVSSFSFMQFFFAPFWGTLSDRIGRRPVFLISIFTSALSYLLFAKSHNIALLLISRVLAGIGSANISTAQAYIADISEQGKRSKAMGIIGAAFGLGFIFGPPIGGILKTHYGIEMVGYTAAALSMLDLLITYLFLPESLKGITYNLSLLSLWKRVSKDKLAQDEGNHDKARNLAPWKFQLIDFNKLFQAISRAESRLFLAINFLYIFAFVNMQVSLALLCKQRYSFDDKTVGYLFAFLGFVSALLQGGLIGRLSKRFGDQRLLLMGSVLMLFGIVGIPFVPVGVGAVFYELIPVALLGLGYGLIAPTNVSLFSLSFDEAEQGEQLGIFQSVGALARIIGPFTGSTLFGLDQHAPYLLGGCFLLIAIYFAYLLQASANGGKR